MDICFSAEGSWDWSLIQTLFQQTDNRGQPPQITLSIWTSAEEEAVFLTALSSPKGINLEKEKKKVIYTLQKA